MIFSVFIICQRGQFMHLIFVFIFYRFVVTGMHNLQQIYFDGENGEELDEFYDPQNNHLRCPDLKISNQYGE